MCRTIDWIESSDMTTDKRILLAPKIKKLALISGELEARKQELKSLRESMLRLKEQMQQLELDLETNANVRIVLPAQRMIRD